jgi:GTP-binding protein HflX
MSATRPRAVLVGVLTPGRDPADLQASLDELGRLCDTLGMDVAGRMTQRRPSTRNVVLLGEGALVALAGWTGGSGAVERGPVRPSKKRPADGDEDDEDDVLDDEGDEDAAGAGAPEDGAELVEDRKARGLAPRAHKADVVVVDHELSPSQLKNLRSACGVEVLDRTGVIIEIFHTRARSREARLQVELARLSYEAPRLRELGGPSERQQGGIGGKGSGESSIELDRRRIRDRMAAIRRELVELDEERASRRGRRQELRQVALVGYTNAGKSSLMRALTGAEIYVADQLFATLDTTVRKLNPEVVPPVLVTDTVGFIRDLPHSLVASFRSTLDAALDASLVLHVVDANDPSWRLQEQVTAEVLADIGADGLTRVLVFNKIDKLQPEALEALRLERPAAWFTAAHLPDEVAGLHARIAAHFRKDAVEATILVPWAAGAALARLRTELELLEERHEAKGTRLRVRGEKAVILRWRKALAPPAGA